MKRYGLAWALAGLLLPAPALAAETPPEVKEVEDCVRKNLPDRSSIQSVTMRSIDRTGGERSLSAELKWKRNEEDLSRILIQVEAPPDLRGSAYLMLEKDDEQKPDIFVYLPELQRVRRITPHAMAGSLFGTDFSYEDFRRLQNVSKEVGSKRLPDAELDGRPVYVLEVVPPPDDESGYERIRSYVDRETCVALKVEMYESGDRVRKSIVVDPKDLALEDETWIPRKLAIRDLKDETQTIVEVEKIQIDPDIPDRLFRQSTLARGH